MLLSGTLIEEHIRRICMSLDAMNVALAYKYGRLQFLGNTDPNSMMMHRSRVCGLTVVLPVFNVLLSAFENRRFEPMFIEFKTEWPNPPEESSKRIGDIMHFFHDVVAAQFVLFFEEHYMTMKKACNFNYEKMNPVWSFGRRIRDAISHGNLFTINDPKFKAVSWKGYTIDNSKNGVKLSDEFSEADLIALLCELERSIPREQNAA